MRGPSTAKRENGRKNHPLLLLAGILGAALAVLFYKAFEPHQVLFANDGPLGAMLAACNRFPGRFFGTWRNTQWLGMEAPAASPTVSYILATIFQPAFFLKVYGPLTLFFVGFSAWVFFRQLEFKPVVCVLGGIAAGLNMHFFSTACWGLGTWNMAAGMTFLALAAISTKSIKQIWAKAILAGLAVGMNLMEGFDMGAIMSVYVGVYVLFRAFSEETGFARKVLIALWSGGLVVFFSAFIAAQTIHSLVATQVEGIVTAGQDEQTKGKQWDRDTQWSLPKAETLRLFTPGIFGYRLAPYITVPDKSSAYWGLAGEDPRIVELRSADPKVRAATIAYLNIPPGELTAEISDLQSPDPQVHEQAVEKIRNHYGWFLRHSGTGEYAGVLVAVLALFALANAGRGSASPYSPSERRAVWFWGAAALFSLLVAWGRHGFLYRLLYQLPYVSTIRNPIKFLQPFDIAWIILAGYGLEILHRRYAQAGAVKRSDFLPEHLRRWLAKAAGFEKKWAVACALTVAASVVGLIILIACQDRLTHYLADNGFKVELTPQMARFCVTETIWFLVFLVLSTGVVLGIVSGAWTGPRAIWAWLFLGTILIVDLGRTDQPWIHFYDYEEKYAMNDVVDFLSARKPWEQRVMGRLSPRGPGSSFNTSPNAHDFGQIYDFWIQNDFPAHNIQSLDFSQMPRMPVLDDAYLRNFQLQGLGIYSADLRPSARLWELTGTRYLLLDYQLVELLNDHADPLRHGFHTLERLSFHSKPDIQFVEDPGDLTVDVDPAGKSALIEFTHALPRAKLYANWQTPTNDPAILSLLASTNFDPGQTVLLATNTPVAQAPGAAGTDAGTVTITDYQPKSVKLQADAKTPAVLLFNDRFAANWFVSVDNKPDRLLRCNYIMRGVFVPPGEHTIEFRFRAPLTWLYISLSAWTVGLLVSAYLIITMKRAKEPQPVPQPRVQPLKK